MDISSCGYRENAVGSGGVQFYPVWESENIDDEGGKGFNLPIPRFRNRQAGVDVGGWYWSGGKVKWCGWILRIELGYAGVWYNDKGVDTCVHVR